MAFTAFHSGDELGEILASDPRYRWRNAGGALFFSNPLGRKTFVEGLVWFTEYEVRRETKPNTSIMPVRNHVQDFGVRAHTITYGPRGDQLNLGFTFAFPQTVYELVNPISRPVTLKGHRVISDAWISYLSNFGTPLTLDLGLRTNITFLVDEARYSQAFEPRLFATLQPGGRVQLKAAFGRFHQSMITVTNEDDIVPLFEAWIILPRKLQVEGVDHYLLGAEVGLTSFSEVAVQAYWKSFRRLALYNRDKIDEKDPDYVNGSGKSYGVELSWETEVKGFSSTLNYTVAWAEVTDAGLTYRPRYDRRHVVNVIGGFRFGPGWNLGIRWELASGLPFSPVKGFYDRLTLSYLFRQGPEGETGQPYMIYGQKNSARLPVYHRLDLSASKLLSLGRIKMMISLNVINLYDRKNIFYFDINTGQHVNMLPFLPTLEVNLQY